MTIKLGPITEVVLYVKDMNQQVRFYRDILGLKIRFPFGKEDYSNEMWVEFESGPCTLALHGGGHGRIGEDTPSVVFKVEGIEQVREALADAGVTIKEVRTLEGGGWITDGIDPEGNRFSLVQQPAP